MHTTEQRLEFSSELLKKYDVTGPRYTSYPTAVQFHNGFQPKNYQQIAREVTASQPEQPLSLYFHIPFCDTLCYYCGCSKIVTRNHTLVNPYLSHIEKELALQSELFGDRDVQQLHWGGGTPTFLNNDEMTALMAMTRSAFNLNTTDEREFSIEIDPRSVDEDSIAVLADIGFNRMSMGVQDFDTDVQKAVNRIQSEEATMAVLNKARENGFKSVSIDLIYGLPKQNVGSFSVTLDKVIAARPDRLAVYNYAHLPHLFKAQEKGIREEDLPSPEVKLEILALTIDKLTSAGYIYIGMDHFALPDDELALAQRNGGLHRNFQGYSTHADCDLVGLGLTSIGKVGHSYSQNYKDIETYYQSLDDNRLAVFRGVELDDDDILRRHIISELMCHSELDFSEVSKSYAIDFQSYFDYELNTLDDFIADGLLVLSDNKIQITPAGRMLLRNIAMQFDAYLKPGGKEAKQATYSRLI